jgi:hypothetical protein
MITTVAELKVIIKFIYVIITFSSATVVIILNGNYTDVLEMSLAQMYTRSRWHRCTRDLVGTDVHEISLTTKAKYCVLYGYLKRDN